MMAEIFIFKTNAETQEHVRQVSALFQPVVSITHWSFDLEDCDRVLRVVASGLRPDAIERLVMTAGIRCEHMEYEL